MKLLSFRSLFAIGAVCLSALVVTWSCSREQPSGKEQCFSYPFPYKIPDLKLPPDFPGIDTLQMYADTLSWKTFVAVNWPADNAGKPEPSKCPGKDDKTVWMNWTEISKIFREGKRPVRLADSSIIYLPAGLAASFGKIASGEYRQPLFHTSLDEYEKHLELSHIPVPPQSTLLIDQNGNPTYFETYYNPELTDQVLKGGLNTVEGADEYVSTWPQLAKGLKMYNTTTRKPILIQRIYFSLKSDINFKTVSGDTLFDFTRNEHGAMMVKVAWKIMAGNDDPKRFFVQERKVFLDGRWQTKKVGMVAMHIAQKLMETPEWIWSTFEQRDNTTDSSDIDKHRSYSYFNPLCDTCKVNTYEPGVKAQLIRSVPLYQSVKSLNKWMEAQYAAISPVSVWKHYFLVGTQWPSNPDAYPVNMATDGLPPVPDTLANTIIESFIQTRPGGCMACHVQAQVKLQAKDSAAADMYPTNFIMSLERLNKPKK